RYELSTFLTALRMRGRARPDRRSRSDRRARVGHPLVVRGMPEGGVREQVARRLLAGVPTAAIAVGGAGAGRLRRTVSGEHRGAAAGLSGGESNREGSLAGPARRRELAGRSLPHLAARQRKFSVNTRDV